MPGTAVTCSCRCVPRTRPWCRTRCASSGAPVRARSRHGGRRPGSSPRRRGRRHGTFGQVDGTANPAPESTELDDLVWVTDGPGWMVGGTYLATRRIRMLLTMWDRMGLDVQGATIGRSRDSGAPLTGGDEFTAPDLEATHDGAPTIAPMRMSASPRHPGPGCCAGATATTTVLAPPRRSAPLFQRDGSRPARPARPDGPLVDDDRHGRPRRRPVLRRLRPRPGTQFVTMQQALSASDALGHFLAYTSA